MTNTRSYYRTARHFLCASLAAVLYLQPGVASASTITFSAGSYFSTDALDFSFNGGNQLYVEFPINSTTPELQVLTAKGQFFDATLTLFESSSEKVVYDFSHAVFSSFDTLTDFVPPHTNAIMDFQTVTTSVQPVPLPPAVWLLLSGLLALLLVARRPSMTRLEECAQ